MKSKLLTMCLIAVLGVFSAHGQELPDKAKAKETIANAAAAIERSKSNIGEFHDLAKREQGEGKPLTNDEKKRLKEVRDDRNASCAMNQQVVSLLKVGDSVFSFPGLLALSGIEFDAKTSTYLINLVIAFRSYEGGVGCHPTYQIIHFDETGHITAISEFATVKMVTE